MLLKRAGFLVELSWKAAWLLLIILLPFTSLPLLQRLSGADMVSPASAIPLAWLALAWFLPYLLKRGGLPRQVLPLLAFLLVAILVSAAAFFTNIPPLKGKAVFSREVQALLTLLVGMAFYLVVSAWPRSESRLRLTFQALNFTGLLIILWSFVQAFFWFTQHSFPPFLYRLQGLISSNAFFDYRVTGFAFEPSWLAHMLNMAFLPVWLAATVNRTSVHRFHLWKISFENLLLAGGAVVLFLSYSRVGWLAFVLTVAYLLVKGTLWLARRLQTAILSRVETRSPWRWALRSGLWVGILASFLVVYTGGVFGLAYVGSKADVRLKHLFQPPDPTQVTGGILGYANYLGFAERVVYWATGWAIFNDHPFLGVGIGNAGYYFPQYMPAFGYSLTEVDTLFSYNTSLPNTKSMWSRLLAETGVVGFAFFISWLFVLWQTGRGLQKSASPLLRTTGLAGSLVIVAFLIEGFSIDSFALPYLWFSMGVLTAAGSLLRSKDKLA
jgi:hypothetical protein